MMKSLFALAMLLLLVVPVPAGAADADARQAVLTGVDVLVRDDFRPLQGRRIGLITNHTGLDRRGRSTIRLLHAAPGVELVALFSPEHGPRGQLDEATIGDSIDPATGIPVVSLY
ncbi:MAG: DUF1343 domain-containing protein, partial [Xanthomonadales bacterium]